MRKAQKLILMIFVSVVPLLIALAVITNASTPSTTAGVAILQFGCSYYWDGGTVYGPMTIAVNSFGGCSEFAYDEGVTGATPVPGGKLYHLRVNPSVGTLDGSIPKAQFTVYDGNTPTTLTCTTTGIPTTCNDLTHQYAVKSGDQIWVNITLPDSNTSLTWATATVEEAVFQ